jgi:hypothetical protein
VCNVWIGWNDTDFFFRIMVDGYIIMINEKRVQIDIKYLKFGFGLLCENDVQHT